MPTSGCISVSPLQPGQVCSTVIYRHFRWKILYQHTFSGCCLPAFAACGVWAFSQHAQFCAYKLTCLPIALFFAPLAQARKGPEPQIKHEVLCPPCSCRFLPGAGGSWEDKYLQFLRALNWTETPFQGELSGAAFHGERWGSTTLCVCLCSGVTVPAGGAGSCGVQVPCRIVGLEKSPLWVQPAETWHALVTRDGAFEPIPFKKGSCFPKVVLNIYFLFFFTLFPPLPLCYLLRNLPHSPCLCFLVIVKPVVCICLGQWGFWL